MNSLVRRVSLLAAGFAALGLLGACGLKPKPQPPVAFYDFGSLQAEAPPSQSRIAHVVVVQGEPCRCLSWGEVSRCAEKPCLQLSPEAILAACNVQELSA